MAQCPSNVVLIGMPGSGKSTVGVILAKQLRCGFLDTDLLIQQQQGRSLQDIVDQEGYLALRAIEESILLHLEVCNHVIATGGSAVYSRSAMEQLRRRGVTVFLEVNLCTLKSRVRDYETRGLAKRPDQTIEDLFDERSVLYRRYADVTVPCDSLTHEEVCREIIGSLQHVRV